MIYIPLNFKNFINIFSEPANDHSPLLHPAMDVVKSLDNRLFNNCFFGEQNASADEFGISISDKSTTAMLEIEQIIEDGTVAGIEARISHRVGGDRELVDIKVYNLAGFEERWPKLVAEIEPKRIDEINL